MADVCFMYPYSVKQKESNKYLFLLGLFVPFYF